MDGKGRGYAFHLPMVKKNTEIASNTSKKLPAELPTLLSISGTDSSITDTTLAMMSKKKNSRPIVENWVLDTCPVLSSTLPSKYAFTFVWRTSTLGPKFEGGGCCPFSSRYWMSYQSSP
mmetsp:Transcript_16425/g.35508  ORF Transcript_16425/g.35508 Transcript_16425/m.35508 type:complete len:119 (-) Transcript_16425:611-967(-)